MASPSKVSTQLEPWCDLEDKVVLITGASSGLGWDFCITLAKAGCKVIAAARRADRLKSLCDQINQSSTTPRAVALALDVTADAPAIEAAAEKAWASFGQIDCLINNSGIRGEKGRRIRELTSVVQKRFKFPENSVELYAEKVTNSGLCVIAQAESLRYKFLGGLAVRSRIVRKKEKPWRLKIDGKFP